MGEIKTSSDKIIKDLDKAMDNLDKPIESNFIDLYPEYVDMERRRQISFEAEVHINEVGYYFRCTASCDYLEEEPYEGRGYTETFMMDARIVIDAVYSDYERTIEIFPKNIDELTDLLNNQIEIS